MPHIEVLLRGELQKLQEDGAPGCARTAVWDFRLRNEAAVC